ncbi:MAG TPA: UvrD-helicase domain-containing protein [Polyangium sp.]|nr:UvrD-helicase domain-containing protein [Polyangium sp.]
MHPTQRAIVERKCKGPARVSGSAGTGKSVVALHRATRLVKKNPKARVLLTTYSRTLAARLAQQADLLLDPASRERKSLRIEHLHKVTRDLWMQLGGKSS